MGRFGVPGGRAIRAVETLGRIVSLTSLRRTRALLSTRRTRALALGIGLAFLLLSMLIGQMLTFPDLPGSAMVSVQLSGNPWWDFPELFVFTPGVALDLLFLPTLTMALVSAGVGIGGTAALVTAIPRLRESPVDGTRNKATPTAAGAGAAITGLATMGACCCTTCAGALGVAVVAAASGTDIALLLRENWYLDVFQLVVVGVALLAQERALRIPADSCPTPPRLDRGFVAGSVLRVALLVAGITWSLAMFVEWVDVPPGSAGPGLWYHWIFEHQLLALAAIAAGMFPKESLAWLRRATRGMEGWILRGALVVAGVTWGLWVPPTLTGLGLGGLINEVLGVLGASVSTGAIAPDSFFGPALLFHWIFQHALLAGFAVALAVNPNVALRPLLRTVQGTESSETLPAADESAA
ncbi:MAG TPA: hypothetical protein VEY12_04465 [Thermoplasmata archaeon]|nr:hypothetical protein [Thermoplasmata archaeon]